MNLENIILRDTRASQPSASSVPNGTLYFVTDESLIERSNGSSWQSYSGISGSSNGPIVLMPDSGLDGLDGFPGVPGPAGPAGSAGSAGPMGLIGLNGIPGNDGLDGMDGWPGPAGPAGAAGGGGGSSDWDFTIVKAANQDVTNSTTLTSDTELTHNLTAGDTWLIEAFINAQSNSFTSQYKFSFLFPASLGWATYIFCGSGSTVSNSQERLNNVTTFASPLSIVGHSAFGVVEPFYVRMMLGIPTGSTTGPCVLQFANVAAGAGLSSRTAIGSIMRGRKIS